MAALSALQTLMRNAANVCKPPYLAVPVERSERLLRALSEDHSAEAVGGRPFLPAHFECYDYRPKLFPQTSMHAVWV